MKRWYFTFLLLLILSLIVASAWGEPVTKKIYYEKKTTLTPNTYTMKFSLWDAPIGGNLVWSEEKTITITATPPPAGTNKTIQTYLGEINSLNGVDFSRQLWVQVDWKKPDSTYETIGTRGVFTTVPYAIWSETGGSIRAVNTGAGLIGGGTLGDVTLSLLPTYQLPQTCNNDQITKWNGSAWTCSNDSMTLPYKGTAASTDPAFIVYNGDSDAISGATTSTWGAGVAGSGKWTGVRGESQMYGVYGLTYSNSNMGAGVYGESQAYVGQPQTGTGVFGVGYYGVTGSTIDGVGVTGSARRNGTGVRGTAMGDDSYGIYAISNGNRGVGIYAEGGPGGYAAVFKGNVQIKSKNKDAVVVELGEGLDYAEGFDVSDKTKVVPGTVLVIDPDNPGKLTISNKPYDTKVAGIIAGARGLSSAVRLGVGQFDYNVALAGRVYANVDATYGEVSPGDLLTTSPTPGYAMVVKDYTKAQGAILGKAMEKLPEGEKGQILVLVTLQ